MSMARCQCGALVDTDKHPDAYLVSVATIGYPVHKQHFECVCDACQNRLTEDELEARIPQ